MELNRIFVLSVFSICFLFSSCSKSDADSKPEEIFVFAAASMTESLTELAKDYEKQQKGKVKIVYNFAGSQSLKTSIESGSKADVFISASLDYMDELKMKGMVDEYKVLLKNRLVVIRHVSSKYPVKGIHDLAVAGIKLAVGDKSVPVGMYWNKAIDKALASKLIDDKTKKSIEANIKTKELNVKDVLSKVVLNEADVGVVYKTDVSGANSQKLEIVELPVFKEVDAVYPAGILKNSETRKAVKDYYDYLYSDKGKEVFKKYKFMMD